MNPDQTTNQNHPQTLVQFLCVYLDPYMNGLRATRSSWAGLEVIDKEIREFCPGISGQVFLSIAGMTGVIAKKIVRISNTHETVVDGIRIFFEAMTFRALRCQLPEALIRKWLTTGTILDDFFDQIITDYMGAITGHGLIPYDELINEEMPELVRSTRESRIDAPGDLVPYLTSFYQEEYRALNCKHPSVRIAHEIWPRYQEMRATQSAVVPSSSDDLSSLHRTQTVQAGMIENLCKQVDNISVLSRVLNGLLQSTEARLEKIEARLEKFEARLEQVGTRVGRIETVMLRKSSALVSLGGSDFQPNFGHS